MLESLITSKTRIKLLLKFFLNSQTKSYLRSLENEFGGSTNAIRMELNHLEKFGLLTAAIEGNKKIFSANVNHPLFADINNILKKYMGIDQIIDQINCYVGDLQAAYLTGEFVVGNESRIINLALIGAHLDHTYIEIHIKKVEKIIQRKINYCIMTKDEMKIFKITNPVLLIWKSDEITKLVHS